MDEQRIFVGRQAELDRFREILEDPRGQGVVVVGQAGMGKTWLIGRMVQLATQHPSLKCAWVRYEVTPTDSVDATMALMMDNAFEAAQTCEGSFDKTDRRRAQWYALLKVLVPKGGDIAELIATLRRDPQRHTREQFLERLRLISTRMGPQGRALFVVDPEKLMCPGCADSWRLVTRELPEKIKFLIAQRPEDELINSNDFMALENVVRLPAEPLGVLDAEEVDDLVRLRAGEVGQSASTLQDAVNRYQGHPYAIQAALDIVKKTKDLADLPQDPTNEGIAAKQWQQICSTTEAIRLFEAYAILEVAVPPNTVQAVSGLDTPTMKQLSSDPYLRGLLRDEGRGQRIYHSILADYVPGQIDQAEQQRLHAQAIQVYRTSLKEAREQQRAPDALAALRLPEHVLAAEGPNAFVLAFVNECAVPLLNLGLLDAAVDLSQQAISLVEKGSVNEAAVVGWIGLLCTARGDLDEAERMHNKALEINQSLGQLAGVAIECGNLGLIYKTRGDLDGADEMYNKAFQIDQKLGRLVGMANDCGNLAGIYKARGDLDGAEKMINKALEIDQRLGRFEGIAISYGNLGLIYRGRGDLGNAETMFSKALEIEQKLGRLEGMANSYANLALICETRGDLDRAEEMHKKALDVNQKLGRLEGMAIQYGNLGLICRTRGDLDGAEGMLNKALEINQTLGRLEGVAIQYGSLGLVCQTRGDLAQARSHWEKALALLQKIGARDRIHTIQAWIDGLPKDAH